MSRTLSPHRTNVLCSNRQAYPCRLLHFFTSTDVLVDKDDSKEALSSTDEIMPF
jgi:hypothetical protein